MPLIVVEPLRRSKLSERKIDASVEHNPSEVRPALEHRFVEKRCLAECRSVEPGLSEEVRTAEVDGTQLAPDDI